MNIYLFYRLSSLFILQTIATVCMFLAGKVEETPRPLKDVIIVSYEIIHKKDSTAPQRIRQQKVFFILMLPSPIFSVVPNSDVCYLELLLSLSLVVLSPSPSLSLSHLKNSLSAKSFAPLMLHFH